MEGAFRGAGRRVGGRRPRKPVLVLAALSPRTLSVHGKGSSHKSVGGPKPGVRTAQPGPQDVETVARSPEKPWSGRRA